MALTTTTTETYSWTETDIEHVMSRFHADLKMIAQSTGTWPEKWTDDVAHDVEYLAKRGYLKEAHVMLFSYGVEKRATVYTVNEQAKDLTSSRPGGVLWPRLPAPTLEIVLSYTSRYDTAAREHVARHLNCNWVPTKLSTSHVGLTLGAGRSYARNGWGLQREDYS